MSRTPNPPRGQGKYATPLRALVTFSLSLLALILFAFFPSLPGGLALAAMLISSLADLILMNFRGMGDRAPVDGFLFGGMLFALAHLVYAVAFVCLFLREAGGFRLNRGTLIGVGLFVFVSLLLVVWTRLRKTNVAFLPAGVTYLFFLFVDLCAIFTATALGGTLWLSFAGILLVLLSDWLIMVDKILWIRFPFPTFFIWLTYAPGQLLLFTGLFLK